MSLAVNGGFNQGFGSWQGMPQSNWATYGPGITGNDPYEGTQFAATNTTDGNGGIYQDIPVSINPGDTFCGSAQVATQGAGSGAAGTFAVWLLGGGGNENSYKAFTNLPGGNAWTPVQTCVTATTTHTSIRVQFYVTPNNHTLIIDNVSAELLTVAPTSGKSCYREDPIKKAYSDPTEDFFGREIEPAKVIASMRAHVEWCMVKDPKAPGGRRVLYVNQYAATDLVKGALDPQDPESLVSPFVTVSFNPNDPKEGWVGEADRSRNKYSSGYYRVAATVTTEVNGGITLGPFAVAVAGKFNCEMVIFGRYFDNDADHSRDSGEAPGYCTPGPWQRPDKPRRISSVGGPSDGEIAALMTPSGMVPVWIDSRPLQNGDGDLTLVTVQDPGTCNGIDDTSPACQRIQLTIPNDALPDATDIDDLDPLADQFLDQCFSFWDGCVGDGWPVDSWGGGGGDGGYPGFCSEALVDCYWELAAT